MKRITLLIAVIVIAFVYDNVEAQLSGSKSIPGDYTTIAAAIADLNANGVGSGGVTFNVAAGHTETSSNLVVSISSNPPTSSNPVVFQKSGAGVNPLITAAPGNSATTDGIIKLSGTDYITFDGIDLLDPSSNTGNGAMEWGYALMRASTTDGSTHCIIKNCGITMQKINAASIGIYIANKDTAGNTVVAVDTSAQNNNNKLYGNTISNVYHGISAIATSIARDQNNEIGVIGQTANSITNWGGSTLTCEGVRCEGQQNIKVNNNIINGGTGTGGGAACIGIIVTGLTTTNLSDYEIAYNQVTVTSNAISQPFHAIRALATGDTISIHHNVIENCNAALNTTSFNMIGVDQVSTSNAALIYDNIIRNNTSSGTGVSNMITTASVINSQQIYSNQIYGNQRTGISGVMNCIAVTDGAVNCYSNTIYNNSAPNSSGTSSSTIYGYINSSNPVNPENVYNNTIRRLTVGGSNTSASSIVSGIRANSNAVTVKEIYGNVIDSLSCVSGNLTTGGAVGIWSTAGTSTKIYQNKISNLQNTGSAGTAAGIWVTSGTTIAIYNNFVSSLRAPNTSNANGVIGINCTSTAANSTVGMYYNTVSLSASGGATFGSSGISVTASATPTTAALELRNNIIINQSTPGSTSGNTVAFRRSAANLQSFAAGDYNDFYAGTSASNRLIFFDGTNSDMTLSSYQTRVAPRDANSKSVSANFVDDANGDLHLTGASIQDVNLCAKPIAGYTTDYDGSTRDAKYPYKGADESTAFPFKPLTLTINFEACPETDTINVVLKNAVSPYSTVDSSTGLGGQGSPHVINFVKAEDGVNYYLVVRTRNSIETWSKSGGEVFTGGALTYDFTSAASQAYQSNMILVGSDYSLYTGDVQQDGIVDLSDLTLILNDASMSLTGYVVTDLNCDDIVDLSDLVVASNNSSQIVSVKRP